jgi:ABC-2 type transport system permease protein
MGKTSIIIAREYNERVRKKSFIITTILMPVLMLGLMAVPTLIMLFGGSDRKEILVIDDSHIVASALQSNDELLFTQQEGLTLKQAREREDIFGVLWIGEDIVENNNNLKLYTNSSSSITLEENIISQLEDIIEHQRIASQSIEGLADIISGVQAHVSMTTIRNDLSEEGKEESTSSGMSYFMGIALGMILYMFLLLYGSMVMTSVIEEKGSRVLDVLVSSVKPFQLMVGKIVGVAAVAATQIVIWAVLIVGIASTVLPSLIPEDTMQSVEAVQRGELTSIEAGLDADMVSAISVATDTGSLALMFVYLLLFLVGGFVFYSSLFAAVGSAVDSVQDSQQLQTPITVPIIISIMLSMSVFNDPNSPVAFWGSMIPFTSPVVVMARIPFEIATWEIILSLVVLWLSTVGMVWVAGKIYRIGVFMHGKKPSLKELARWIVMK